MNEINDKNFTEIIDSKEYYGVSRIRNEWLIRFESESRHKYDFNPAISLRDAVEKISAHKAKINCENPIVIYAMLDEQANNFPVICILKNGEIKQFRHGYYLANTDKQLINWANDINEIEVCKTIQRQRAHYQADKKHYLEKQAENIARISEKREPIGDKLNAISNQINDISLLLGRLKDDLDGLRNQ